MDRRSFLKGVLGFSVGFTATQLAIPSKAKGKMAIPVAELVTKSYLDDRIRGHLQRLKKKEPNLVIGETHCHSTFSDGSHAVETILHRAAHLGLDFVVLTEHLTPKNFPLWKTIKSIKESQRCVSEWSLNNVKPVKIYPAFEVSTSQGHLVLVLDEDYLKPKKYNEIEKQFSSIDNKMISMPEAAKLVEPFGGISILAHPEQKRSYPFGVSVSFANKYLAGLVDGVEDISAAHVYEENYSEQLGMASIGCSDDHFNLVMGTTITGYNSNEHKTLISAVKARKTRAIKVDGSLDPIITVARLFF